MQRYFRAMEYDETPSAANLIAIAQQLGQLAAHLRDLAQKPLGEFEPEATGQGFAGGAEPGTEPLMASSS